MPVVVRRDGRPTFGPDGGFVLEPAAAVVPDVSEGWLSVMAAPTEGAEIELYPVGRVLAVTDLHEVGLPGHGSSRDG